MLQCCPHWQNETNLSIWLVKNVINCPHWSQNTCYSAPSGARSSGQKKGHLKHAFWLPNW